MNDFSCSKVLFLSVTNKVFSSFRFNTDDASAIVYLVASLGSCVAVTVYPFTLNTGSSITLFNFTVIFPSASTSKETISAS